MAMDLVFPTEDVNALCYQWINRQHDTDRSYDNDRQLDSHLQRKVRLVEQNLLATLIRTKFHLGEGPPHPKCPVRTRNRNPSLSSESEDDEENDDEVAFVPRGILRHRPRRCRGATTPCATSGSDPKAQKRVRFADSVGQQLARVQHVVRPELPPAVPSTALDHLRKQRLRVHRRLHPLFTPPPEVTQKEAEVALAERVQQEGVVLEHVRTVDNSVQGEVRVRNVAYEKLVAVRYTLDDWATHTDVEAHYVKGSPDERTDRFAFSLFVSTAEEERFVPGCRLHMAVRYEAGGEQWWDNNSGRNYTFECYATTVPLTLNQSWVHFS